MKQRNNKTVVLTAGGTGGHIYPAEALAVELRMKGFEVIFYTDERGLGNYKGVLSEIENVTIASGSVMGKDLKTKALSLLKVGIGVLQAMVHMLVKRPKVVVGFGGYASFPTAMAAVILRIPLIIHEQNSVMSRTNRILAPFARWVAQSFNHVRNTPQSAKTFLSGMPIRGKIAELNAKEYVSPKAGDKFNTVVLGGSQGAHIFSEVVPQMLGLLDDNSRKNLRIYQQCRKGEEEEIRNKYHAMGVDAVVESFFVNMDELYTKADVMISRSGASSIYEIAAAGVPAILVPLASAADNHQYYNAKELTDANGALLIEQKDFTAENLLKVWRELADNAELRRELSYNAKRCAIVNAQVKLAEKIEAIRG
ncbi:MAG: undecaprenyldiphospho-muramoylpentapeptide beta-N-acetylglucosaminyltransferase [Alphaproteobacteria bacterium]|nr:undecaprenyldiphospho-muramoylpentapeptide beta-N-acetylglucosaminyltransferase [Alphaproteobacteria bacterium]